jgi:hypothetical protein
MAGAPPHNKNMNALQKVQGAPLLIAIAIDQNASVNAE